MTSIPLKLHINYGLCVSVIKYNNKVWYGMVLAYRRNRLTPCKERHKVSVKDH